MWALLLAATFLAPHYTQILQSQSAKRLAVDSLGNAWVIANSNGQGQVTRLDPDGNIVFSIGIPLVLAQAVAVDSSGAVYVVGTSGRDAIVVAKMSPAGSLVYQRTLGMGAPSAIAVDAQGDAYVTGFANSTGLAATPGAFQTVSKGEQDAFVLKLDASGSQVLYTTFIGGSGPPPSTPCMSFLCPYDDDAGTAIAVDAAGNAYVAGITNSLDFPVTVNAFQAACPCSAWVARFNPTGTALIYSTFVPAEQADALAIDTAGNAYVAGAVGNTIFPTTPGALFTHFQGQSESNAFVSKLRADGSALVYSTFLGPGGTVGGVAIDAQENLTIAGTATAGFPSTAGTLANGSAFLARLNANGGALLYATLLPTGAGGLDVGIDANGNPVTLGQSTETGVDTNGSIVNVREAALVTRFTAAAAQPVLLGAVNSASDTVASQLIPGEFVSLFGGSLGPSAPVGGSFDASGTLLDSLGGTTVYFNGVAAPLLYVQAQQINAIVPFEVAQAASVTVTVVNGSTQSNALVFPVGSAEPRTFTSNGFAAVAQNEDGTLNSDENPAKPGAWITVYATGGGLMSPAEVDGKVGIVGSLPELPVSCMIVQASVPPSPVHACTVLYAGSADWLISGGLQINLRLPGEVTYLFSDSPSLEFQVGSELSVPVAISVSP